MAAADADRFRQLGFVKIPRLLGGEECRAIVREYEAAFASAFGPVADPDLPVWLPGLADTTPVSARLVVDDGRLWETAERLIGPCVPCPPEVGLLGHHPTPWHQDDPLGLVGVKFLVYVDGPSTGLWLWPGSHRIHDDAAARLARLEDLCLVVPLPLDLDLGDAVAIDLHVWHCFTNARRRVLWAPEYIAVPGAGAGEADRYRAKWESVAEAGTSTAPGKVAWPVWREWVSGPATSEARRRAIDGLSRAGAFVDDHARR